MDMKVQRFGIEVELTGITRKAAADIKVYNGYYGLQMELDKVKPSSLEEFSSMLAGYCLAFICL